MIPGGGKFVLQRVTEKRIFCETATGARAFVVGLGRAARRGSETGRRDVMIRRVSERDRNRKNSIEPIQTRRSRGPYLQIDDSDRMEFR